MKPLHPLLVHFPIALTTFAVAADGIAFFRGPASLASAGGWAMVAAGAAALATGVAGYVDMRRLHRVAALDHAVHPRVHRHMYVGIAVVVVLLALALWRGWLLWKATAVPMLYVDAGVIAVALIALQGWLGGELVYGDGVFVKVGGGCPLNGDAASSDHASHEAHH